MKRLFIFKVMFYVLGGQQKYYSENSQSQIAGATVCSLPFPPCFILFLSLFRSVFLTFRGIRTGLEFRTIVSLNGKSSFRNSQKAQATIDRRANLARSRGFTKKSSPLSMATSFLPSAVQFSVKVYTLRRPAGCVSGPVFARTSNKNFRCLSNEERIF